MSRLYQGILIVSVIGLSWLGMQVVHESGHVVAAWAGGETVHRVILHPLAISRTDASHDRHPVLLTWGGPVLGSAFPLVAWGLAKLARWPAFYLLQFFAGFCLVANGCYLGVGSFSGAGDAGDLLRYGSPRWLLIAFGLATAPLGLYIWNGLGPYYGLGEANGRVNRRAAVVTLALLLLTVLAELLLGCPER
jgi:hypothetical protein